MIAKEKYHKEYWNNTLDWYSSGSTLRKYQQQLHRPLREDFIYVFLFNKHSQLCMHSQFFGFEYVIGK